jgi:hypothetical protein
VAANVLRDIAINLGIAVDTGAWKAAIGTVDRFNLVLRGVQFAAQAAGSIIDSALLDPIRRADEIRSLSDQTGIATDTIQELGFAAEQTNTSAQALALGVKGLTRQAFAAATGGKEAQQTFGRLGIAVKGADGKIRPVNDLLEDASDSLAGVENDAERSALAMKLFGRAGTELQPFLAQGSARIRELRQEAQELGIVMNERLVNSGDELNDSFGKLRSVFRSLGNAAARGLVPWIQAVVDRMTAWFKTNGQLLRQGIERFFETVGHVAEGIGRILGVVVNVIHALFDILTPLAPLLSLVAQSLLVIGAISFALNHPILALGAAFLLALDDAKTFIEGGESLFDDFFANTEGFVRDMGVLALSLFAPFVDKESRDNILTFWGDALFDVLETVSGFWDKVVAFFSSGLARIRGILPESISNVLGLGGGAASPAAAATGGAPITNNGGGVTANQQNTVSVNVQGGTNGASPQDIGSEVARVLEEQTQEHYRQAFAAFAPAGT